jgi:hypothetical protein
MKKVSSVSRAGKRGEEEEPGGREGGDTFFGEVNHDTGDASVVVWISCKNPSTTDFVRSHFSIPASY